MDYREPPVRGFVSLAEALSFLGWRCSMARDELYDFLGGDSPDPAKLAILEGALSRLIDGATAGTVQLVGKARDSSLEVAQQTTEISRVSLLDYQRYDILCDGLLLGGGIVDDGDWLKHVLNEDGCARGFEGVHVERVSLLAIFAASSDAGSTACVRPLPSEEEILARCDELWLSGKNVRELDKIIPSEERFRGVKSDEIRRYTTGRYPNSGRSRSRHPDMIKR